MVWIRVSGDRDGTDGSMAAGLIGVALIAAGVVELARNDTAAATRSLRGGRAAVMDTGPVMSDGWRMRAASSDSQEDVREF